MIAGEKTNKGLRRVEIRRVLKRHRGSVPRLATELQVSRAAVYVWLSGRSKSARVAAAAERRAMELMAAEREGVAQ